MLWFGIFLVTSLLPPSSPRLHSGRHLDNDLEPDSSQPDYASSSFFDGFPDHLDHFPEFGEIFRLSRTTTQRPPFRFPGYVREAFPGDSYKTDDPPPRRRRPPRPASSSSSRTKVSKGGGLGVSKSPAYPSTSPAPSSSKTAFPKVFRFTQDRVNLADFDSRKKVNENYLSLSKGDGLDAAVVRREGFYILHGGVFEIEGGVPR